MKTYRKYDEAKKRTVPIKLQDGSSAWMAWSDAMSIVLASGAHTRNRGYVYAECEFRANGFARSFRLVEWKASCVLVGWDAPISTTPSLCADALTTFKMSDPGEYRALVQQYESDARWN